MIETVILDWSGVVSDDWEATYCMVSEILEKHGLKPISRAKFRQMYEIPWMGFYKKLGLPVNVKEERAYWEKNFPKHYGKIKMMPTAKRALERLHSMGVKALVFSAHNQALLEKEAKEYGIAQYIEAIKGSLDDKRLEIENLVSKHEIERGKTLYAGDMVHDLETARLAKVKSVAVLTGYDSKEKLEKAKPNYLIESLGELPGLIEEIGGKKVLAVD